MASQAPSQMPEAKVPALSTEVLKVEIDFLSMEVHQLMCQYPAPLLTQDMEKKVRQNDENLFKFKLMDMKDKMMKMPTYQFDQISQGRVAKQTEEFCFTISKTLFSAVKRARTII